MYKPQKKLISGGKRASATRAGWFEILLYMGAESVLEKETYINLKQYMLADTRLYLGDFYGPYDVYESMFQDGEEDKHCLENLDPESRGVDGQKFKYGLPRMLGEYDIINSILRDRITNRISTTTMLLIDEKRSPHLIRPKAALQYRPGRALSGLMLEQPLPPRK